MSLFKDASDLRPAEVPVTMGISRPAQRGDSFYKLTRELCSAVSMAGAEPSSPYDNQSVRSFENFNTTNPSIASVQPLEFKSVNFPWMAQNYNTADLAAQSISHFFAREYTTWLFNT